jgi:hypothetical protein
VYIPYTHSTFHKHTQPVGHHQDSIILYLLSIHTLCNDVLLLQRTESVNWITRDGYHDWWSERWQKKKCPWTDSKYYSIIIIKVLCEIRTSVSQQRHLHLQGTRCTRGNLNKQHRESEPSNVILLQHLPGQCCVYLHTHLCGCLLTWIKRNMEGNQQKCEFDQLNKDMTWCSHNVT